MPRTLPSAKNRRVKAEPRYTVGLAPSLATEVEHYARISDTSMSKAIAALVRLGLEGRENRERQFLEKLETNLGSEEPGDQDRLTDEFRGLILGG